MVNSLLSTVAKACPCASKNCRRMNDQPGPYGRFIRSGQNDDHGPAQKQNTKKFPGKHDESSNAQKCHREASQLVEPVARKLMLPGNVNKKCHQASDKSISFCHAEITTKESNFEQNKKISKKQFDSNSLAGISCWQSRKDYQQRSRLYFTTSCGVLIQAAGSPQGEHPPRCCDVFPVPPSVSFGPETKRPDFRNEARTRSSN